MVIWERKLPLVVESEKGESEDKYSPDNGASKSTELHRGLKARQVSMIAIGGAIGTGLIIGTGSALAKAGPGSIFIAYSAVGFIVWLVMAALGEMAAWLPIGEGFSGYATRFCDPALGFALGWSYWFKYIILVPNQLTAASLVIQYWVSRDKVNPGVFITVFLVAIIFINYFGIKFFGEFEFWLSSIKVLTLVGVIILSLVLALGGGPDHDRKGFRYWKNPGAFKPYPGIVNEDKAKFVAFWSVLVNAVFAYLGTELIGVTVGEAQNPRKTIPQAIKLTFYRILFFYCLSVLFLGMIVPYNSPDLLNANKNPKAVGNASASPFVVAIKSAGIKVLPGFLNGCILLFVFSASNSDLYIASRTIYGLGHLGKAPRFLAKTNSRGVPIYSLGLSTVFSLLAYMNIADDSRNVFNYFVNLVSMFGLLTWISLLVTHIYFVKARKAQKVSEDSLTYKAPLGIAGSYIALFFCCLIAITKNFTVFLPSKSYGKFNKVDFVTGYIGIPIYLLFLLGYKVICKTKTVNPYEADLFSGKAEVDRQEEEFLAEQAARSKTEQPQRKFYRIFISWLF